MSLKDKELELKCKSKVIHMENVEEFEFRFEDPDFPSKIKPHKSRELVDVEGILIHANWADYFFNP